MQRVVNYGSFMQAYALMKILESLGHNITFCDFRPGEPKHLGKKVETVSSLKKTIILAKKILLSPAGLSKEKIFRWKLAKQHQNIALKTLGITAIKDYNYNCDVMIIGSDEVFNYTQNHIFGYVPTLFGHGIPARSIIAYAVSAGYTSIQDVEADNMGEEIAAGFVKFDQFGVRDQNTYDLVARYANTIPTFVIDPTLLYDFDAEIPPAPIKLGYVLIYAYNGRLDAPEDVEKIRTFAKSKGLRVISVGFYHGWCTENLVVSPLELLSVFQHATYVITDTFHGSIFSIKNQKPFVSLIRGDNKWGSNSNKLGFLLHQLGLEDRINRDLSKLAVHLDTPIDYPKVYSTLDKLRQTSMQFLTKALNNAEAKIRENS